MDVTSILAIYGAVISTILLSYRILERSESRKNLLVRADKFIHYNEDKNNFHNGRKGDQHLRVRITNKSVKDNSIESISAITFHRFWGIKSKSSKFRFNFIDGTVFPFKLTFTEQKTIYYPLNMPIFEYHQSWKSNVELLQEFEASFLQFIITDTHGKTYYSKGLKIKKINTKFLL